MCLSAHRRLQTFLHSLFSPDTFIKSTNPFFPPRYLLKLILSITYSPVLSEGPDTDRIFGFHNARNPPNPRARLPTPPLRLAIGTSILTQIRSQLRAKIQTNAIHLCWRRRRKRLPKNLGAAKTCWWKGALSPSSLPSFPFPFFFSLHFTNALDES